MKINQVLAVIVFIFISTIGVASDFILNPDANANKLLGNWRSQRPNLGNGKTFVPPNRLLRGVYAHISPQNC